MREDPENSVPVIDKRAVLARHFLFGRLGPAERDRLLSFARERRFANGQILFQKGEAGTSLMAVLAGRVKISVCSEDGKELILNMIEPGEVLGEIALIDGKARSADAVAVGECVLLVIRRSDFIPFLKENPEVAIQLLGVLCQKLRATSDVVETVGLLPVPVRLARLFLRMAATNAEHAAPEPGLRLPSQTVIGNLIGATRESVNKQLRAWQAQGLIRTVNGHMVLLKKDELEDIAG